MAIKKGIITDEEFDTVYPESSTDQILEGAVTQKTINAQFRADIDAIGTGGLPVVTLQGDVTGISDSDGNISTTLGANKVTTNSLQGSAVTTAKIADGAVTLNKLDPSLREGVSKGATALQPLDADEYGNIVVTDEDGSIAATQIKADQLNGELADKVLYGYMVDNVDYVQRVHMQISTSAYLIGSEVEFQFNNRTPVTYSFHDSSVDINSLLLNIIAAIRLAAGTDYESYITGEEIHITDSRKGYVDFSSNRSFHISNDEPTQQEMSVYVQDFEPTVSPGFYLDAQHTIPFEYSQYTHNPILIDLSTHKIYIMDDTTHQYTCVVDTYPKSYVDRKQDLLVDGDNIATINGQSLLDGGDLTIGGGIVVDSALSTSSENPVQNKVIAAAIGNVESLLEALL